MISGGMSLGAGMKFRNPFRPNTRNIRPNKIRTMAVTMRPADFFSRAGVSTVGDVVSVMFFLSMSIAYLYSLTIFVCSMARRRWRLGRRVSLPPSPARSGKRFGSQRSNGAISIHKDARGRGLRADESEFARVGTVRKEAFAPAQQDRADEQQNLVNQSFLEQHGGQRRTSPDDQVRAGL